MQKQEAITIIENTFSAAFDEANFTLFVKNLLNDLDTTKYNHYAGNLIKDAYRKHVKQYKRIGKYTDPNGDAMDVLIVEVTDQYHLDHARTSLRNFVITHLDSFEKDYALVAFYSHSDGGADWRFSFVKLEYKTKVNEGKIKQEKELTPAKRYSFLVGEHEKAHTAKKQLLPLLENIYNNPTIEELEGAFSIEAVTDEFFEQYKTLFVSLTEQFEQNHKLKTELAAAGIEIPRFTKKLLGQIVFLYFLQKKGWMGVPKDQKWGTGEKRFLQKLFDEAIENGKNFFGDFLQYLFYEALAHKHNDEGVQGYFAKLNCKVPFLNGGLFEADYDWENDHITIPNELFRNDNKIGKNGDIGSGVLDVFDRYNFTIKEDEPLEKEVAVDPEMLGKVFENMLEVTERKSKGAFYTPREIVHYMCQESLIHYLDNAVNTLGIESIRIPKEDIETFIRKGFFTLENDQRVIRVGKETVSYHFQLPETIRNHAELLDQKLSEIRVCDPAIGSGAFPVGMLHEIVNARLVLRPHLKNQENHTNQSSDNYSYQLKRHTIQECIYGVDIDASAIDIARLRLWLSLVVDEEDLDTIEALPNLDYKIVCGNSLIGFPENWSSPTFNKLEVLKKEFFKEIDSDKKKTLKQEIDSQLKYQLGSSEKVFGYKVDFDFKLFFSEIWHERGGFDVVIGNPPYGVSIKGDYRQTVLKLFEKVPDFEIYYFFIELSYRLLKPLGISSYIIPNSILFNVFASQYRIKTLNKWDVNEILDCTNFELFKSAVVRNVIFNFQKSNKSKSIFYRNTEKVDSFNMLIAQEKLPISKSDLLEFNQNWGLAFKLSKEIIKTIDKIKEISSPLNDSFLVSQGYIPYRRKDLVLRYGNEEGNNIVDKRLWHSEDKIDENWIKEIHGRDISKYEYEARGLYVNYGSHVASFVDLKFFNHKRLLIKEITNPRVVAGIVDEIYVNDPQIISVILKDNDDDYLKLELLWCTINSELASFYHFNASPKATKGAFPKILVTDINNFPISKHILDKNVKINLHILRSYIICTFKSNLLMKSFFEQVIDSVIYEMYFPNEFHSAGKEILKHLGDLNPITEEMSPEQKLSIVQSEFERLYDPNHPVRNNVETLDSVEEVRIIREALK